MTGIALVGTQLRIQGTGGDDVITVNQIGNNAYQASVINAEQSVVLSDTFAINDVRSLRIWGLEGNDTISNRTGNGTVPSLPSTIYGGRGSDTITGGANRDVIMAGTNSRIDIFAGVLQLPETASSVDTINGGEGRDYLYGSVGTDTISGGPGDDYIRGGSNNDTLNGGADADRIFGDDGEDTLNGGSGNDDLFGGDHDDILNGGSDRDELFGGDGDDLLRGGDGDDDLYGEGDHDRLFGERGADELFGGSGNDGLFGGIEGGDELNGNSGNDRFLRWQLRVGNHTINMDTLGDRSGSEAIVNFRDVLGSVAIPVDQFTSQRVRGANWVDREIEQVDAGLHLLHMRTGNDNMLEKSNGGQAYFFRVDAANFGDGNTAGFNESGKIYFTDAAFANEAVAKKVAIHEMAHHWDERSENRYFIDAFRRQSGWKKRLSAKPGNIDPRTVSLDREWNHDLDAAFSDTTVLPSGLSYGRTDPLEDWATMWEQYFQLWEVGGNDAIQNSSLPTQNKLKMLDAFFNFYD